MKTYTFDLAIDKYYGKWKTALRLAGSSDAYGCIYAYWLKVRQTYLELGGRYVWE